MKIIKTKGIVMKEYTIRESDKFISIFTKSKGKLMVNAPYAKRHNRGLASSTQVFVYGEFVLQENKGTYRLIQAEIIEAFHDLRNDLLRLAYSAYVLEFIDATMEENLSSPDVLRLLVRTFQAMCKNIIKPNIIRHIFELKHMCLLGFMPNLFSCNSCGQAYEECERLYFDVNQGGIICGSCGLGPSQDCFLISQGTLHTMQYVASVHIDELYMFTVSDEVLSQYNKIITAYISYYIDKEFKTLKFARDIEMIK